MKDRAKHLVLAGLERVLAARGLEGAELALTHGEVIESGRARLGALVGRRGVVGGIRVVVTRPGRAELRPFEVAWRARGR